MRRTFRLKLTLILLLPAFLLSSSAYAGPDEERVIAQSKQVLVDMMNSHDSIPEELLAKCKAIAIYPFVLKGGFLVGGRYGRGIVLKRDPKTAQWGPLSFSTIAGASGGLQIGIQATDLVLIILNDRGLDSLLTSKFTLGGDLAISVGPAGTTSEISTDFFLRSMIVSYSRSRGLFGGIALNGALVIPNNGANSAYYGRPISAEDILLNGKAAVKPSTQELINTINEYAGQWQKRQSLKIKPAARAAA